MKVKLIFIFSLIAGTLGTAGAQTMALDPAVRTGKLPNGFTYYIRHNEEPKNRVMLYLVNKAALYGAHEL
jgi:zinc protease